MYGENDITDQMCPMWFVKFRAGDFSRGDAPRSGRPVEVDGDEIETLTENNQHHIMWEMANILKVSKSIKLLVKMKSVPFILWKKPMEFWGNPIFCFNSPKQTHVHGRIVGGEGVAIIVTKDTTYTVLTVFQELLRVSPPFI